jgi:uncharacterized OsmC-like protein
MRQMTQTVRQMPQESFRCAEVFETHQYPKPKRRTTWTSVLIGTGTVAAARNLRSKTWRICMQVTVKHLSGSQFEASARGHRVLSDQPPEMRGSDQGMTPPELLLTALGACAGYYAAEYLRARSLSADGIELHLSAEKALQPPRLAAFRIEVVAPGAPDDRSREGLIRAVKKCLIHNTLLHAPEFEIVAQAIASAA